MGHELGHLIVDEEFNQNFGYRPSKDRQTLSVGIENRCDEKAIRLAVNSGVDPNYMSFKTLFFDDDQNSSFLSTHPGHSNRDHELDTIKTEQLIILPEKQQNYNIDKFLKTQDNQQKLSQEIGQNSSYKNLDQPIESWIDSKTNINLLHTYFFTEEFYNQTQKYFIDIKNIDGMFIDWEGFRKNEKEEDKNNQKILEK